MTTSSAFSLRCSSFELALLCSLAGSSYLVGLPDPLEALTVEEVEERLGPAVEELARQGHCEPDPLGKPRLSPRLDLLMSVLVQARGCLCLSLEARGRPPLYEAFYSDGARRLRLSLDSTTDTWTATLVRESPLDVLLPLLTFSPSSLGAPATFQVPEREFRALLTGEGQDSTLEEGLSRLCGPGEATLSLARCIQGHLVRGVMAVMRRFSEAGWMGEGMTFFEGDDALWRFRPCRVGSEDWLRISRVGPGELANELMALGRQFETA